MHSHSDSDGNEQGHDHRAGDAPVLLLDHASDLQRVLWRDGLPALSHQLLDEVRHVAASQRDVLDAAADDVAVSLHSDAGDTTTTTRRR